MIDLDRAPGAEVWEHAERKGFAIATRDLDLSEMAMLQGAPPLVI